MNSCEFTYSKRGFETAFSEFLCCPSHRFGPRFINRYEIPSAIGDAKHDSGADSAGAVGRVWTCAKRPLRAQNGSYRFALREKAAAPTIDRCQKLRFGASYNQGG